MNDMIRIRSIREYFEEFGIHGIGKGQPVDLVKNQIMDAFRKEIFDQISWKLKVNDISEVENTPKNNLIIENIMKQSYKKWVGLVRIFNRYRETLNVLKPDDLKMLDPQREMYDPFDGFDDEDEEEPEDDYPGDEIPAGEDPEAASEDSGLAESTDGEGPNQEEPNGSAGIYYDGEEAVKSGYVRGTV